MSDATDSELTWGTPDGRPTSDRTRDGITSTLREPPFSFEEIDDSWVRTTGKWWDPDDDVLTLSRSFPGVLFSLYYRYLGSEDDFGFNYYLDGRLQHAPAEVRIPPFDPAKLCMPRGMLDGGP